MGGEVQDRGPLRQLAAKAILGGFAAERVAGEQQGAPTAEHRQVHPVIVLLQVPEQRLELRQAADGADESAQHPAVGTAAMQHVLSERFGHVELRRREQAGVVDDAGQEDANTGQHGISHTVPTSDTPFEWTSFRPSPIPCLEMVPPFVL